MASCPFLWGTEEDGGSVGAGAPSIGSSDIEMGGSIDSELWLLHRSWFIFTASGLTFT